MKIQLEIPDNTLGMAITLIVQEGIYNVRMQAVTMPTDSIKNKGTIDLVKLAKEKEA